jgi:hypothetical protein
MSHPIVRSISLSSLLAIALVSLAPAAARAASEGGWALAHDQKGVGYAPNPSNSFSSAGKPIRISRLALGSYKVNFTGLGAVAGGNVQVTSYNASASHCKTSGWSNAGTSTSPILRVNVLCFTPYGAAVDARFVVIYSRYTGTTPADTGYMRETLTSSSGTPAKTYQWNASGGAFYSRYLGVGTYALSVPGMYDGGSFVTALGTGSAWCLGDYVFPDNRGNVALQVHCYKGYPPVPANAAFTLAVGEHPFRTPFRTEATALGGPWSGEAADPTVWVRGKWNSGSVYIEPQGVGTFLIRFPTLPPGTSQVAMVTALDQGHPVRCNVDWFGPYETGTAMWIACNDAGFADDEAVWAVYFGTNY